MHILVVEDELIIAENIRNELESIGYRASAVAVSGEEAVQKAVEMQPDLVLMDIKLQGAMDGVAAAEEIRSRFDIPVVYLTGYADEKTLQRAKITDPFGYVLKPFELRELRSTIEMALYKHKMDRKLRESEARYRAISELISDYAYSFRVEPDGTYGLEWLTEAFTRIIGFTPDEIDTYGWERIIHPDDLPIFRQHTRILLSGQPDVSEHRVITKSGEVRWWRDYSRPVLDEVNDRVVRIYGAAQDITEHKQTEEAIRHYADIVNNMQVGLHVYHLENPEDDSTLRMIATNPAASQATGLAMQEVLGKTIDECFPGLRQKGVSQIYADIIRTGKTVELEEEVYYSDDRISETWLSVRAFPLPNNCVGVLFEDITLQKQAEESVRQNQKRYQAILEDQTDLICRFLPDGTLTLVNEAYCSYFGKKRAELIGHNCMSFIFVEDQDKVKKHLTSLDQGNPVATMEYRVVLSGQEIRWQQWTNRAIFDEQDRLVEYQSVGRDITERKQAEEQLQRYASELKEANAELAQYAYVVSHDVRAPLRAIHNYADFLQEDLADTLTGEHKIYLDGLGRAVHEAELLVEDLLALSRIGRQTMFIDPINIGAFLRELVTSLDLLPDVEIIMAEEWPTLETEPVLLRQIYQNLILNGVKFNHASPKVLELGWQSVDAESYQFFVRDNGIGIDPRYHEQIFRVFERLYTSETYEGTGIGLAIVKKAANKLGGTVWVESRVGEGSTFFVTLPRHHRE